MHAATNICYLALHIQSTMDFKQIAIYATTEFEIILSIDITIRMPLTRITYPRLSSP
jgi:hypothetical protein